MDWFERLGGFRERNYEDVQRKLEVDGETLISTVNGKRYGIGRFELASLGELRARSLPVARRGRPSLDIVQGDVRQLHRAPDYRGALFQVASQFNMLEMIGPNVCPEQGVTRYEHDQTQGPACAIAAGAATIYRNYFVPIGAAIGQTRDRQLDGLAEVGAALATALGRPLGSLWAMQNGYALLSEDGAAVIARHLSALGEKGRDDLRAMLRIGLHWDVEVTDSSETHHPVVSQAFCSALPVAYMRNVPRSLCEPFARLVLEAAYEATLRAAATNAARGQSNIVLLTMLGGGAFGNDEAWIVDAIEHGLETVRDTALDVRIVSYRVPSRRLSALVHNAR